MIFENGVCLFKNVNVVKVIVLKVEYIIFINDFDVFVDLCWVLSYLLDGSNEKI